MKVTDLLSEDTSNARSKEKKKGKERAIPFRPAVGPDAAGSSAASTSAGISSSSADTAAAPSNVQLGASPALTDKNLEILQQVVQQEKNSPSRTASAEPSQPPRRVPVPATSQIQRLQNVVEPQRKMVFTRFARTLFQALDPQAALPETKRVMSNAVLELAAQVRNIKSRPDKVEMFNLVETLIHHRLPKLEGQDEIEFNSELARLREELLPHPPRPLPPVFADLVNPRPSAGSNPRPSGGSSGNTET